MRQGQAIAASTGDMLDISVLESAVWAGCFLMYKRIDPF